MAKISIIDALGCTLEKAKEYADTFRGNQEIEKEIKNTGRLTYVNDFFVADKNGGVFGTPGTAYYALNVDYQYSYVVKIEKVDGFYVDYCRCENNSGSLIGKATVNIISESDYFIMNIKPLSGTTRIKFNAKVDAFDISDKILSIIEKQEMKQWKDITWVAFGDSLTERNARAAKFYHDYIFEETGIKVLNHGLSGSGYAHYKPFYSRIATELVNTNFDVITIFGSGNDRSDLTENPPIMNSNNTNYAQRNTTSLCGLVNMAIDEIYKINPYAKIGIITPTPWRDFVNINETTGSYENNWMEEYSNMLVNVCKLRKIPCLDLFHSSGLRPENEEFRNMFYIGDGMGLGNYYGQVDEDGIHPNSLGHKWISSQIREFLNSII